MSRAHWTLTAVVLALLAFPVAAKHWDELFYVSFASRVLIYALAASSLNLILGYGGMVSFGHAAFLGTGAYTVAILMAEGVESAWVSWPLAVALSALLALVIGAISLRTRGVYFIMITLAFAQMTYYLFISMRTYGGEDGLNLARRSRFGFGLELAGDLTFYYVVLAVVALGLYLMWRLLQARFGQVVQAIRENETRMEAIGFPTYRYKLTCFAIAGGAAGLAGALLANQNGFVSPNLLQWTQSGTLMVIVILGGVGYLWGGPLGALVFLLLEEVLSGYTIHWQLGLGVALLAIVLFARQGIAGLLAGAVGGKRSTGA
ncbi:MAG TPA: branched-chain amino acid ABC transporter permease [Burkholderiales bacterium]|nr:branched-chain amino acid ABC transporter permease [Burkholderiales bacterium]